ncbi:dynein regulatory complex subunit 3 [Sander lucioperca]|uniref:dynein regulatory complex subunit 3 n=1 Tax=Sander lucioperca TaxID=283035 RepID=UPI00125E7F75|nr:dynein regulatory complex subunit 3 [Sander lucioperca]XP_031168743.1 dynein regulatory complex subunit 3 [Sander lucioperca]XP_031168744.1 dynein regulatory complex subunit 3 [Sander lucioperca]XP_031168745.1 dynein regulatory complex subunit 3 [Sander lucioperca]XP_035852879.1 dynein regulatory complex subunit 3 [Sander lucioperca]
MTRRGGKSTTLMDEEILKKAIVEQAEQEPQDQAGLIIKAEEIHFNEILKLRLEYRNILIIDHLWEFTSLAKLDLNHNLIEKIEGLDRLINLTWLNLTFNSIEKIEGLESLRKLEVLNLSNNRISVIENMDTLEKITHFFIANNLIEKLDKVLYLRKFKNLFTVNLFGNPVSKEDDYKFFIAAYFPNLVCLDYRLLDEKTKNEASIKYHYVLEEMKCEELLMQQADEAEQSQESEVKLHTDAFVEFLNGSYLFKSMFEDDPEAETLHCVPEVAYLLQTFEHQMVELCMQLFEIGLAERKRRETEVNSFFGGQNKAVMDYQQKASEILENFEQEQKKRIVELKQLSDPDLLKVKINHYNDEINQLCNSLMALEFQLVSQLEDIIKKLDINISDMVGNFSETVQGIFVQCRDLEDNYNEKVRKIAVATLEDVAKDKLDKDMPDDVKMLFTDKDTVMDALTTGHDNHLLKINGRETQLVTRVNAWKVALIKGIQDKELKRNRMRISDIHRYVDHLWEQLEELQYHHL